MRELNRKCRVLSAACRIASERLVALEAELEQPAVSAMCLGDCLDAIGVLAHEANAVFPELLDLSCRLRVLGLIRLPEDSCDNTTVTTD